MIFEIKGTDVINIDHNNTFVIALSANGSHALISSQVEPTNVDILNTISESNLTEFLDRTEWKQPHID